MDNAANQTGMGEWGQYWIWHAAERLFGAALRRLDADARDKLIIEMFSTGTSLGWLSEIWRHDIFAHGVYGARPQPESERLLSADELHKITKIMRVRFRQTAPEALLQTPDFLSMLFAWIQSGPEGKDEAKAWVGQQIASDEGLLAFLERARSWAAVNDKIIYPVRPNNLKRFLDVDSIRERLRSLLQESASPIQEHASRLLRDLRDEGRDSDVTQEPVSSDNRFVKTNSSIVEKINAEIRSAIIGKTYKLIFNPQTNRSKKISFNEDGHIGEGRNHNEAKWRIRNGRLEITDENNLIHSRFIYVVDTDSFHHTGEDDAGSIKGQSIVPL